MPRRDVTAPLFPTAVVRGLIRDVIKSLPAPGKFDYSSYAVIRSGRFAAWMAAVERDVSLLPDVLEMYSGLKALESGGTYADYQGPLDAISAVLNRQKGERRLESELAIVGHRAARVRNQLAWTPSCAAQLRNDPEPTVRMRSRETEAQSNPLPWWKGVLSTRPPDSPEVLEFGELCTKMQTANDWTEGSNLAKALRALPKDLASAIAPMFMPSLWCPESFVEAVWEALLKSSRPLGDRVGSALQVLDRMLSDGAELKDEHAPALASVIANCPADEREAFQPLVARMLAPPTDSDRQDRCAPWARVPRVVRTPPPNPAPCPRDLFEKLVRELAEPSEWGRVRWAQHPRARYELARGLEILHEKYSPLVRNAPTTLRRLADLVGTVRGRRYDASDEISMAIAGLLSALDVNDPLFRELVHSDSAALREAVALSELGDEPRHAWKLLEDAEPRVWTAARMATPTAEPWRGLFANDPLETAAGTDVETLILAFVSLERAVPRVRFAAVEDQDYISIGRHATALFGSLAVDFAFRFIPKSRLHKSMAMLVAAVISAEGGWDRWTAEVASRVERNMDHGTWFGGNLLRFAVLEAESPTDGGPAIVWPIERRRRAAQDALARYTREPSKKDSLAEMWLKAAAYLWPLDDDPMPLPGPWTGEWPDYSVAERLESMNFRPEWRATHALMEGARAGFGPGWSYFSSVEKLLERIPTELKRDAAFEGYWRRGPFGEWSRKILTETICDAERAGVGALTSLLADPRVALERLLDRDRLKQTLFVLRARLVAGMADFAEALQTLTLIALQPETEPWTSNELAAWRVLWSGTIQHAMAQGPGGVRGVLINLAPHGLWEQLDRAFVHAVAMDATREEAQSIARRLALCGDTDDMAIFEDLAERYPDAAPWPRILETISARKS